MQAIMETAFDVVYLVTVITLGVKMIAGCRGEEQFRLFGIMAVVLGAGDAFHLVPRAVALCTTGLENYTAALGIGKWVTSVTMTIFYVLLYYVWRSRYHVRGNTGLTAVIYLLAGARIVLSFGFYIPVVLWADVMPMIGMLMIPKTCAYVWAVSMGYRAMKQGENG